MATFSRRGFMKLTGAGVAAVSLGQLGFDLKPAYAYAKALKIEGAKEVISTCAFCSCGCQVIMHIKNGQIVSSEGDPDYPVSEGSLCPKGAAFYAMHVSDHRVLKPRYRAPGSDNSSLSIWSPLRRSSSSASWDCARTSIVRCSSFWTNRERLVEFVEAPNCRYFVATQAHPEFRSRPMRPHPLFAGLIRAAVS